VDAATRARLVQEHESSARVLSKYLRGQDIHRWAPEWAGFWVLLLRSSSDHAWPWSNLPEAEAEKSFASLYPAIHRHLKASEQHLRKRTDKGRFWWELRSCAYYEALSAPKLVYQEIQFHPAYALETEGMFLNNKVFFLPNPDKWLLACSIRLSCGGIAGAISRT